jgi:hypothetical protein
MADTCGTIVQVNSIIFSTSQSNLMKNCRVLVFLFCLFRYRVPVRPVVS